MAGVIHFIGHLRQASLLRSIQAKEAAAPCVRRKIGRKAAVRRELNRRSRAIIPQAACASGQMISIRPPGPEWMTRRNPCSFAMAATRFNPRPMPGVLRILSDR